jgi:hypothetical protein
MAKAAKRIRLQARAKEGELPRIDEWLRKRSLQKHRTGKTLLLSFLDLRSPVYPKNLTEG